MTTHKIEVAHEPLVKQRFNWLLAIGIFIVGLGLGAFVTTLPIVKTEIGGQNAAGPMVRDVPARPGVAEPAAPTYSRGPTLAEYTAAIEENKANVQRAIEAETARYNGLVKFYGAKDGANSLTWPPRPTQFHIPENAGVSLDENALAAYHQSERDFTSIITPRIQENALDAYHQSEWGRPLSPGLPSVKNDTDADQDLGLMEFFTVPDETSRQRPEPGTLEALSDIDPADRNFFNPGYGAYAHRNDLTAYHQSEWGRTPNTGLSIEAPSKY